jgi:hypothetical protein
MSRGNSFNGAAIVCAIVLSGLLDGCTRDAPTSATNQRSTSTEDSVSSDGLPEVIISAPRSGPKTIVLSERNVVSAARGQQRESW